HWARQLSRSARRSGGGSQRLRRHHGTLRAGRARDDRRARSAVDCRAVRLGGVAGLREAAGVARGAGGARRTFPVPQGVPVRSPRTPLRRSNPAVQGAARTMKWTVLGLLALLALLASVMLGPAAVPLAQLAHSDIVWNLRAPRA